MPNKIWSGLSWLIWLGVVAAAVYFYPILPASMASHWNYDGVADGFMNKFWALAILPIVMLVILILSVVLPKLDPLKANILSFKKYYEILWLGLMIFMAYLFVLQLLWNLGYKFDFTLCLTPAMSGLWLLLGLILGKTKRNWFMGIRTPWTLSSDNVWDKTHHLGGKLFIAVGLISLLGLVWPDKLVWLTLLPILIVVILLVVYSYWLYRCEKASQN